MSKLALFGGNSVISEPKKLSKMFVEYPFAEKFSDYVGSKYALTTSSGTASLICSLIGAGIQAGDEVITVSYTWFCTATSILQVGAIPIFVDIDEDTFMMDSSKIEEKISERTKAILAVSLYGQSADYDPILKIAKKHNLVVIDDACQSTGAKYKGQRLGNVADITAFSFSGKPIVSTGGGVLTTNNEEFYERSLLGGEHPSYISTHAKNPNVWRLASTGGYGNHYRIDGKCAERAFEQLEKLDALNSYRRENAKYLTEKLKKIPGIKPPVEKEGNYHVYHMFSCVFESHRHEISRDEFVDALNAEGVSVLTYISSVNFLKTLSGKPFSAGPLHYRALFQDLYEKGHCGPFRFPDHIRPDYRKGSLPVTEKMASLEFNIHQRFLGAPYDKGTMDRYVEAIEKVLFHSDEIVENRNRMKERKPQFLLAYESDS